MLTHLRYMNRKKARTGNTRLLRCKLEDFTGSVECVMWPDDYLRSKDEIHEDRICFVKAAVERTRDEPGLVIGQILSVEQARRVLTKGLVLGLAVGVHSPETVDALGRILQRTPGPCPVFLSIRDAAGKRSFLKAGEAFGVNPNTVAIADLETILGPRSVTFSGLTNGRNGR